MLKVVSLVYLTSSLQCSLGVAGVLEERSANCWMNALRIRLKRNWNAEMKSACKFWSWMKQLWRRNFIWRTYAAQKTTFGLYVVCFSGFFFLGGGGSFDTGNFLLTDRLAVSWRTSALWSCFWYDLEVLNMAAHEDGTAFRKSINRKWNLN